MALRSNMAAWSGCVTCIIYEEEDKNPNIYSPVTEHTMKLKARFSNQMNTQLWTCNNEVDDKEETGKKK